MATPERTNKTKSTRPSHRSPSRTTNLPKVKSSPSSSLSVERKSRTRFDRWRKGVRNSRGSSDGNICCTSGSDSDSKGDSKGDNRSPSNQRSHTKGPLEKMPKADTPLPAPSPIMQAVAAAVAAVQAAASPTLQPTKPKPTKPTKPVLSAAPIERSKRKSTAAATVAAAAVVSAMNTPAKNRSISTGTTTNTNDDKKMKKKKSRSDAAPSTEKKKRRPMDVIPTLESPIYHQTENLGNKAIEYRDFYDGVQIKTYTKKYDEDFSGAPSQDTDTIPIPERWQVHVGDVVAVQCFPSNPPSKKPFSRKSVWFPFAVEWSPAQIICIYQDFHKRGRKGGEEVQMELRWLFRVPDMKMEAADVMDNINTDDDPHPQKTVYETQVIQQLPVSTVLGKVVVTGWDVDRMMGKYQDEQTGIPQTHYVCSNYLDKEDVVHQNTDWKEYAKRPLINKKSSSLPKPLLRGFKCENSHLAKDNKLMAAYLLSVTKRWSQQPPKMIQRQPQSSVQEELAQPDAKTSSARNKLGKTKSQNSRKSVDSQVVKSKVESKSSKNPSNGETGSRHRSRSKGDDISRNRRSSAADADVRTIADNTTAVVRTRRSVIGVVAKSDSSESSSKKTVAKASSKRVAAQDNSTRVEKNKKVRKISISPMPELKKRSRSVNSQNSADDKDPPGELTARNLREKLPIAKRSQRRDKSPSPQQLPKEETPLAPSPKRRRSSIRKNTSDTTKVLQAKALIAKHSKRHGKNQSRQPSTHENISLADNNAIVLYSVTLSKVKRREFLKSTEVTVIQQKIAPRVVRATNYGKNWHLRVGDVVCVENPDAKDQTLHVRKKHTSGTSEIRLWYPFTKPWSVCQVLSIYRDVEVIGGDNNERTGEPCLEIRWLFRESELSKSAQKIIPFFLDENLEELFESNNVVTNFAASSVLGRVELLLGNQDNVCNFEKPSTSNVEVPKVQCRCKHYIHQPESVASFQSLFSAETSPTMWYLRMVERGQHISLQMKKYPKLKEATSGLLGTTEDLFSDLLKDIVTEVSKERPFRVVPIQKDKSSRQFFSSISIAPEWAAFHLSDLVLNPSDRKDRNEKLRWTFSVGDVVALQTAPGVANAPTYSSKSCKWYPFTVPWSPCQVLAIYRDVSAKKASIPYSSSDSPDDVMVELRWFYRESDLEKGNNHLLKVQHHAEDPKLEILYETNDVEKNASCISSILGPIVLIPQGTSEKTDISDVISDFPFMPLALHMYGGRVKVEDMGKKPKATKQKPGKLLFAAMEKRGIDLSTHYTTKEAKADILRLLSNHSEIESSETVPKSLEKSSSSKENKLKLKSIREKDPQSSKRNGRLRRSAKGTESIDKHTNETLAMCPKAFVSDAKTSPEIGRLQRFNKKDDKQAPVEIPAIDEVSQERRVRIPDDLHPYHTDFSSLRSYYSEISIFPPYEHYVLEGEKEKMDQQQGQHWTVKMGDVVVLHWDVGAGKTDFALTGGATRTHHPFRVCWGVCEIVTIWKTHSTKSEMSVKNLSKRLKQSNEACIMLEVRWLYRKDELPGSAQFKKSMNQVNGNYEEVMETDHFDDAPATSILSPVTLHDSANRTEQSKTRFGMPVLDFHCRRYWSIHRKALVPCGGLDSMNGRGRMHSRYLGKDRVLSAALNRVLGIDKATPLNEGNKTDTNKSQISIVECFREVIKKLSLTDASEDTDVRGLTLTGREREQNKILSFLRSAITGETSSDDEETDEENDDSRSEQEASVKSSIFIAGPPGTGKTACVRSVIEQLRHEQAKGAIPEFDFISLNGMEMRHPFEAYVKLWEGVSGAKKEKKPPDISASLLERHFVQNFGEEDDGIQRPVTVLLLDEIDYLVTKKQTVLYNFFDWPLRTAQNRSGPRLVVVGISNTLNLPERLKPSVQSRLGGERCDFQSYKVDEMVKILKTKIVLEDSPVRPVFEDDAILFAARKTAALSGDVRKALQICKSAAEAVLMELEDESTAGSKRPPIVRIGDVQKVSRESFSSVLSKAVSLSTPFEALLLVSLASLTRTSGLGDGGFDMKEVMTKMESIAGGSGDLRYMPPPTFDETLDMLNRLGEARLVSLHTPKSSSTTFRAAKGGSGGAWPLISLPMEDSGILSALRDSEHKDLAEKYLGRTGLW